MAMKGALASGLICLALQSIVAQQPPWAQQPLGHPPTNGFPTPTNGFLPPTNGFPPPTNGFPFPPVPGHPLPTPPSYPNLCATVVCTDPQETCFDGQCVRMWRCSDLTCDGFGCFEERRKTCSTVTEMCSMNPKCVSDATPADEARMAQPGKQFNYEFASCQGAECSTPRTYCVLKPYNTACTRRGCRFVPRCLPPEISCQLNPPICEFGTTCLDEWPAECPGGREPCTTSPECVTNSNLPANHRPVAPPHGTGLGTPVLSWATPNTGPSTGVGVNGYEPAPTGAADPWANAGANSYTPTTGGAAATADPWANAGANSYTPTTGATGGAAGAWGQGTGNGVNSLNNPVDPYLNNPVDPYLNNPGTGSAGGGSGVWGQGGGNGVNSGAGGTGPWANPGAGHSATGGTGPWANPGAGHSATGGTGPWANPGAGHSATGGGTAGSWPNPGTSTGGGADPWANTGADSYIPTAGSTGGAAGAWGQRAGNGVNPGTVAGGVKPWAPAGGGAGPGAWDQGGGNPPIGTGGADPWGDYGPAAGGGSGRPTGGAGGLPGGAGGPTGTWQNPSAGGPAGSWPSPSGGGGGGGGGLSRDPWVAGGNTAGGPTNVWDQGNTNRASGTNNQWNGAGTQGGVRGGLGTIGGLGSQTTNPMGGRPTVNGVVQSGSGPTTAQGTQNMKAGSCARVTQRPFCPVTPTDACHNDAYCPQTQKCCKQECGNFVCKAPVMSCADLRCASSHVCVREPAPTCVYNSPRPGSCPAAPTTRPPNCPIRGSAPLCRNDVECPGAEKCCSDACRDRVCRRSEVRITCAEIQCEATERCVPNPVARCVPRGQTGGVTPGLGGSFPRTPRGPRRQCPVPRPGNPAACTRRPDACTRDAQCTARNQMCCRDSCGRRSCSASVIPANCNEVRCQLGFRCVQDTIFCATRPCIQPAPRCERPGHCPARVTNVVCTAVVRTDRCQEDRDCTGSQKCCKNDCGQRVCVAPGPSSCYALTCTGGTVCEQDPIARQCRQPPCNRSPRCVKPGVCPVRPLTRTAPCRSPPPVDSCTSDTACSGTQKCCKAACGNRQCQAAKFTCSQITCPRGQLCVENTAKVCPLGRTCDRKPRCVKSGRCPAVILYSLCAQNSPHQCTIDGDCLHQQKCCANVCGQRMCKDPNERRTCQTVQCRQGYQCLGWPTVRCVRASPKVGSCPARAQVACAPTSPQHPRSPKCTADTDCPGFQKCCVSSCGGRVCFSSPGHSTYNKQRQGSLPNRPGLPNQGGDSYLPVGQGTNPYTPNGQATDSYLPSGQGTNPYTPNGQATDSYLPSGQGTNPYTPNGQAADSYLPTGQGTNPYTPNGQAADSYLPTGQGTNPYAPNRQGGRPNAHRSPGQCPVHQHTQAQTQDICRRCPTQCRTDTECPNGQICCTVDNVPQLAANPSAPWAISCTTSCFNYCARPSSTQNSYQ